MQQEFAMHPLPSTPMPERKEKTASLINESDEVVNYKKNKKKITNRNKTEETNEETEKEIDNEHNTETDQLDKTEADSRPTEEEPLIENGQNSLDSQSHPQVDDVDADAEARLSKSTTTNDPSCCGCSPLSSLLSKFWNKPTVQHVVLLSRFFVLNCVLLFLDIATDINTAWDYIAAGHWKWGSVTIVFILAPFTASLLVFIGTKLWNLIRTKDIIKRFFGREMSEVHYEPFENVIWQFPLFHPIKNFRLFLSLLLMDTQLPVNKSLVAQIKGEVVPFALYEAFLESAPQFIFQLSLVLRTGFITLNQAISVPFSLISLVMSSSKLFYSQRLGRYRDTDPPLKNSFLIGIWIFLQNLGFLSAWIFISAYFQVWTIFCVAFVVLFAFVSLYLISNSPLKTKNLDVVFDGLPQNQRKSEQIKIFFTALFTVWVSPCTVWSNNLHGKTLKERENVKSNNSRFLMISSFASIVAISICFARLWMDINLCFQFKIQDISNAVPVTHCLEMNENLTKPGCFFYNSSVIDNESKCLYTCDIEDCINIVRVCEENEAPTKIFNQMFAGVFIFFLFLTILPAIVLQYLGDFHCMTSSKCLCNFSLIHQTVINDLLQLKIFNELFLKQSQNSEKLNASELKAKIIESENLENSYDSELEATMEKSSPNILNAPDKVSGKSCLHFAFQKGFFDLVCKMIRKGGNIELKNHDGESIVTLMEYSDPEKIERLVQERGYDITKFTSITRDGHVLTFNINIHQGNQKNKKPTRKVNIFDSNGGIVFNRPLNNDEEVALAMCFLLEAADISAMVGKYSNSVEINDLRNLFNNLAKIIFKSNKIDCLKKLKNEIGNYITPKPPLLCLASTLHNRIKMGKIVPFWILHYGLGANLHAYDPKGESALQLLIETEGLDNYFRWIGIKNGAISSTTNKTYIDEALNVLQERSESSLPHKLNVLFFASALKGKTSVLEKFLKSGYSPDLADEKSKTALHYAAREEKNCTEENEDCSNKMECIKKLLEAGAKLDATDMFKQMPIHFAAKEGNYHCLKALIDKKDFDISIRGQFDQTPLHLAAEKGNSECLKLLIEHVQNKKQSNGETSNEARYINMNSKTRQTPLHLAAMKGHKDCIEILLNNKANCQVKDFKGRTPFDLASSNGHAECAAILMSKQPETTITNKIKRSKQPKNNK